MGGGFAGRGGFAMGAVAGGGGWLRVVTGVGGGIRLGTGAFDVDTGTGLGAIGGGLDTEAGGLTA